MRAELYEALREVVLTAWPEVLDGGGVWYPQEIATEPFGDIVDQDRLPLVVIAPELRPTSEWGTSTKAEAGPVLIHYVTDDAMSVEELTAKLEALRDYLWPADPLTHGQVEDMPELDFDTESPANAYFLENQKPFQSGALVVPILLAEF